jgi:hypothetical protein
MSGFRRVLSCLLLVGFVLISGCKGEEEVREHENLEHADVNFWRDGFFVQANVDMSRYDEGILRANVDGSWADFEIRSLPEAFLEWNVARRLEALDMWGRGEMPSLAGPHSGSVATQGIRRLDTQFTINNAVKGIGFLPKPEKIDSVHALLKENWASPFPVKLELLKGLYKDFGNIFDDTKQVSLELYTEKAFETHTFLNIMANPVANIVFLDVPSYELKCLCRLLHPDDENLGEEDRKIVDYINTVHDFIHGEAPRQSIAMVFYVIEVFDNSPPAGRGMRIVP